MKLITATLLVAAATTATAYESFTIHPTIPGTTIRDFSATNPGYNFVPDRSGGGTMYPTIPGTSLRDFGGTYPSYKVERGSFGKKNRY